MKCMPAIRPGPSALSRITKPVADTAYEKLAYVVSRVEKRLKHRQKPAVGGRPAPLPKLLS